MAMAPLRYLTTFAKWLALELVAMFGAVGYILLSNALPERSRQVLAGIVLLLIVAGIVYRLVHVLRDPVSAVDRQPKR